MRARMVFAGLVAITTLVIAGPASAKVDIEKVNIIGPGLDGGLHIRAPDTRGMWGSGIGLSEGTDLDLSDGIDLGLSDASDDMRAASVEGLGLTHAGLGSRYVVIYRLTFSKDTIRQDLYPYARGGPVTYIAPDQELSPNDKTPAFVSNMSIIPGWYQGSTAFLGYLIADHGFPEEDPVAAPTTPERAPDPTSGFRPGPWAGLVVIVAVLAALLSRLPRRSEARA